MPPAAKTTCEPRMAHKPVRVRRSTHRAPRPADAAVLDDEPLGFIAAENADGGRLLHRFDQRLHDGAARHVAAHAHDAAFGMRRLAGDLEFAFQVAVEGDAVIEQVVDAVGGLGSHQTGHRLVDDAVAGDQRVGDMFLGVSPSPTAAAMPACAQAARSAAPDGRRRDDRHRFRRQLQGAEQSGEPAADDQHAVLSCPETSIPSPSRRSML
jgi:hypothetical protein